MKITTGIKHKRNQSGTKTQLKKLTIEINKKVFSLRFLLSVIPEMLVINKHKNVKKPAGRAKPKPSPYPSDSEGNKIKTIAYAR